MKKICSFFAAFLALFTVLLPPLMVSADEDVNLAVDNGCSTLLAKVPLAGSDQKVEWADAVILYELNTDTLLYAYQADMQINPTGLVKLLTALVAIENGDLDEEVTVYSSTLNTVAIGSVSAGLKAGEILTLRDLLYCVMVSSANDAAAVIAAHIGGNQAGFVEMLNAKAAQLGCTASNFANAHGLATDNQYSTARDLAIITEAALENDIFVEMFTAKSYTVPATNKSQERVLYSTNHMMSDAVIQTQIDTRVTGGKPAAASNTDRSMICTAEVGTSRYLCVVISSCAEVSSDGLSITRWNIFEEVSFLLDFGFANFAVRQVINSNQSMYQYAVSGGSSDVVLKPSRDISVVLPIGFNEEELRYNNVVDASTLRAPLDEGACVGELQIQYGSVYIGECLLIAMNRVQAADSGINLAERITFSEPVEAKFNWKPILVWAAAIIATGVMLVIAALIAVRALRNARLRAAHRRRARDRRRNR